MSDDIDTDQDPRSECSDGETTLPELRQPNPALATEVYFVVSTTSNSSTATTCDSVHKGSEQENKRVNEDAVIHDGDSTFTPPLAGTKRIRGILRSPSTPGSGQRVTWARPLKEYKEMSDEDGNSPPPRKVINLEPLRYTIYEKVQRSL